MISRHLQPAVLAALSDSPVVLIVGARQVGKSTLMQSLAFRKQKRRLITFDDANILAAAKTDPAGFLAAYEEPLALDEVQRVPELFLALKAAVDRDRTPGKYLMSGSANVLFLPKIADSLAGRMEVITLRPFSQGEIEGTGEGFIDAIFASALPKLKQTAGWMERQEIQKRTLRGGFPEVVARPATERRRAWFGSYLTTILQRDVRELTHIDDINSMPRLLTVLAARTGSLLNAAELSRSSGIAQTTLKRYLGLLETIFLYQNLPAWSGNVTKRFVKMPKAFLADTGLASHLLNLNEKRLAEDPNPFGPLLENFVFGEIQKQISWSKEQPQIFHWRTHTHQEVDFVLESGGRLIGIEVKARSSVTANDFKGLKALAEKTKRRFTRGIVLYTGADTLPFGENLLAMPVSTLWRIGAA